MDNRNDYTINSVKKALKLLRLFDIQHRGLTLMEISQLMSVNKSSTLRLVTTLKDEGFLKMDPDTKKYSLGVILFHLGNLVFESMNIQNIAKPIMKRAANLTGMVVHLGVMQDEDIVVVEKVWPDSSVQSIRMVSKVGGILPIHCTGIGKLFLSSKTDDEVKSILAKKEMTRYTQNTITTIDGMLEEIRGIRRQGFAMNNCEHEDYMVSINYPIYNQKGKLVAAMSLSSVKEKFFDSDQKMLHSVLNEATRVISAELGWRD